MQIEHKYDSDGGFFYINMNNERLALLKYFIKKENKMVIEHTEVSEKLKGQGVGKKLIHEAINFARTKNMKIIPVCPFAHHVIHKNSSFQDIL